MGGGPLSDGNSGTFWCTNDARDVTFKLAFIDWLVGSSPSRPRLIFVDENPRKYVKNL